MSTWGCCSKKGASAKTLEQQRVPRPLANATIRRILCVDAVVSWHHVLVILKLLQGPIVRDWLARHNIIFSTLSRLSQHHGRRAAYSSYFLIRSSLPPYPKTYLLLLWLSRCQNPSMYVSSILFPHPPPGLALVPALIRPQRPSLPPPFTHLNNLASLQPL